MRYFFARCAAVCLAGSVSGCAAGSATNPVGPLALSPGAIDAPAGAASRAIQTPALIVVSHNGILKYYPVTPQGGRQPRTIAKIPNLHSASSMVADGHVLAIARQTPPAIVRYNLATKSTQVLPDPYGAPIDLAIDKSGNIYALNRLPSSASTVTVYPAASSKPTELSCTFLVNGAAIAADNEGDVLVNGSGAAFTGVVEFPSGPSGPQSQNCKKLALQPEEGYVAGLAVDPKTDDLIVLDDPGSCSGGIEGQMTIYPKPYRARTGRSVDLNGHCVGIARLDAASRMVFALDRPSTSGQASVIARSYPSGSGNAAYWHHNISGFTTLPNALPN